MAPTARDVGSRGIQFEVNIVADDKSLGHSKHADFLATRPTLKRIRTGGWIWNRTLRIKSDTESVSCRLFRSEEQASFESVVLPSGDFVHVRDAASAEFAGQGFGICVGDEKQFQINLERQIWKSPRFFCIDEQSGLELTIARVGGQKWYQHDFLASEHGDLQIDGSYSVYFATSIPLPLAIGLKLLLNARFDI